MSTSDQAPRDEATDDFVTRRGALASGAALSLLSVVPLVSFFSSPSFAGSQAGMAGRTWAALSGRVTTEEGLPIRHATLGFDEFTARTDGDGRFFVNAKIPEQGPLSLKVTAQDGKKRGEWIGVPQRLRSGDRITASLSLTLTG